MTPDGWFFKEWRKHRGLTLQAVADKMDMSIGHLSDLERGKRGVTSGVINGLASAYGVGIADLLASPETAGRSEEAGTVPLVGYVGAGAEAHYYAEGQGPFDYVRAPPNSTPSTVAAEIRGVSLGPFFEEWLVYWDDVRSPVTPDMIGQLCIVGLPNGKVFVKKLQPSRTEGLFHLLSQTEEPVLDQEVLWAARVTNLSPR